ncbi:MAG TPA: type II toxin-antitoxin system VapC family toxin [Gemmataceae bacterium]|jgi:predicted nucleic acid-binding protein|nr:type II toxin-antitoxin system VapC family toxin [Gemmataceae bacterium]
MKYVLDSSVAVKWVLSEIDSDKARTLRDEFSRSVHELLAPDIFPVEAAHALTKAERQNRINVGEPIILWSDVLSTPPQLVRHRPLLPRAIAISSAAKIGIYDCLYIALAEREACEFATADDKLVVNLPARFPFIVALSSLP